jgi:hypothetical protein
MSTTKPNVIETYLLDVAERAGKTGVQAALLAIGANMIDHFNILSVNWLTVGEFAAGGFVLSVLTSFASGAVPSNGTASLVPAITSIQGVKTVPTIPETGEEYQTFAGVQAAVDAAEAGGEVPTVPTSEPVTVAPVADSPLATAPNPVTVTKDIELNADGTVTVDGVIYHAS